MDTQINQVPEDDRKRRSTLGGRRDTESQRYQRWEKPQGPTCNWVQVEGGKGGPADAGYGGKNLAHGAGRRPSSGGWQVAGVGDVQVDRVPFRGNRWG